MALAETRRGRGGLSLDRGWNWRSGDRATRGPPGCLEDLLPLGEHVVQRVPEVRRRVREIGADPLLVDLPGLLDLVAEHGDQVPLTCALVFLLAIVDRDVGREHASEAARLLVLRAILGREAFRN